jgi:hypothetical protein
MAIDDEKHDGKIVDVQPRTISMDIKELYKFKPEDLTIGISSTHYSNVTYMQVAPRDVVLDFLELPGIIKDGKMVIEGTRIYMSHVAAQTLVEKLGKLLENSYNNGDIAKLEFSKPEEVELSSIISRSTNEEKT